MTHADGGDQLIAAVDLGSNSFRMVIARQTGEDLQPLDRLRVGVRLAAALDEDQCLTAEGQARGIACLQQFEQRIRNFAPGSVRAVGTNTLRKARNAQQFLEAGREALGHKIEIISGQEEARLIYLGTAHSLPASTGRRLVVDIGGGSTECIIGEGFEPRLTESLYMGCVSFTQQFFGDGLLTRETFDRAELAAELELRSLRSIYTKMGWSSCAGASGTVNAIGHILRVNGWSKSTIDQPGLDRLRDTLISAGSVDNLSVKGLRSERSKVIAGGLAILRAIFDSLAIESMSIATGALREGVLYDLLGRIRHEDVRERTIRSLEERFQVDVSHGSRVERTAEQLFDQIATPWQIDTETARMFLRWGARLCEIGLAVAHSGFHKHGAYLVANADLPGFSHDDQRLLSFLIRSHRRKIPVDQLKSLPKHLLQPAKKLCVILRFAVVLTRSRSELTDFDFSLTATGSEISFRTEAEWLDAHPLTRWDLENEIKYLGKAGLRLRVEKRPVSSEPESLRA